MPACALGKEAKQIIASDKMTQPPQEWLEAAAMAWTTEHFRGQKYASLKKDCIKKGELFVDPEFQPNNKSLFYSKVDRDIVWKRPKELCKVPRLVVEGVTCDDLNEGELGNSWFVSACACLAQEPKLFQKVVPDHKTQEWSVENEYGGIFHFHFWRYGQWVDVVVDDLLPTKDGKLVFCHSSAKNEFWSALVEKAYAKLYGDYESLSAGFTIDALVDFTGGVGERVDLGALGEDNPFVCEEVMKNIGNASEHRALISAVIACAPEEIGMDYVGGLRKGRGYSVTRVLDTEVPRALRDFLQKDELKLVRLSPSLGGVGIWTGAWSDGSEEMNQLTPQNREKLGIVFSHEGEFWMAFEDFCTNFSEARICHFVNTSFFTLKKSWSETMMHGSWRLGHTGSENDRSGGSEEHRTFLANPQYAFDIPGDDSVMVSLEQDDSNVGGPTAEEHLQIGFHIMKVEDNRRCRVHIRGHKIATSEYVRLRSIFRRVELTRGRYVVTPTTKDPGQVGKFLLRMYTSNRASCKELVEESPTIRCCLEPYVLVSRLVIIGADGLEREDAELNPLVSVTCEGETVKSAWLKGTATPEWNMEVIFYRRKPQVEPIIVELLQHKTIKDESIGVAEILEQGDETPRRLELGLFGKSKKEREVPRPGVIYVELTSSDDLAAL